VGWRHVRVTGGERETMLARRASAGPTSEQARIAEYRGLLKAAEANPEEFFTIAGEKLAALLRELDNARRATRRKRAV
jgi:hypothetical protein